VKTRKRGKGGEACGNMNGDWGWNEWGKMNEKSEKRGWLWNGWRGDFEWNWGRNWMVG
jgi:hypothetical protein